MRCKFLLHGLPIDSAGWGKCSECGEPFDAWNKKTFGPKKGIRHSTVVGFVIGCVLMGFILVACFVILLKSIP